MHRDAKQPAFAASRHILDGEQRLRDESAAGINQPDPSGTLGDDDAAVGKKSKRPGDLKSLDKGNGNRAVTRRVSVE